MFKNVPSSVYALIFANLISIVGVIYAHWSVVDILFLYWTESVIIGIFNVLKMATVAKHGRKKDLFGRIFDGIERVFLPVFFTIHYGGFMAGHLFFIWSFAYYAHYMEEINVDIPTLIATTAIGTVSLVISHGYSFVVNYWLSGERKKADISRLMLAPYIRVIIMQITLIIGMMLSMLFRSPIYLLILFIVLKIFEDIAAHLAEHRGFAKSTDIGR